MKSPVLRSGAVVFLIAGVVVVLFIAGSLLGVSVFRPDEGGKPTDRSSSPSAAVSATEGTASPSGSVPNGSVLSSGSVQGSAKSGPSGSATPELVRADKAAIAGPPKGEGATPPKPPLSYLDGAFGAGIVPPSAAGLTLRGAASVTKDRVSGGYAGPGPGPIDMLELVVTRESDSAAAIKASKAALAEYSGSPLSYEWGSREISQGATQEDRPQQYPAILRFVWPQGRYMVQMTVVPLNPGEVAAARDSALEFVDRLPY